MKKVQDIINAMSSSELDKALLKRKEYLKEKFPILELNKEMSYRCVDSKDGYFLEYKWWQDDEWCEVSDLTEMKVWEYNELVEKLHKHYPDYPIEYLEGRFV